MAFFPQKMLHKVPGSFAGAGRRGWDFQTFQSYWFYHLTVLFSEEAVPAVDMEMILHCVVLLVLFSYYKVQITPDTTLKNNKWMSGEGKEDNDWTGSWIYINAFLYVNMKFAPVYLEFIFSKIHNIAVKWC